MTFNGNVAIVTGGGGELGRALCVRLSRDLGMHCIAIDMDVEGLALTDQEVRREGGTIATVCGDVRDRSAMTAIARDAAEGGRRRLAVWVNNAGVSCLGAFSEISQDAFDLALDVNLHATINNTRIALAIMGHNGSGVVVNIASVAGHVAAPFFSAYAASKHAVVGFTRALQLEFELTHSPLKIMLVSPGFFRSKMLVSHGTREFPQWLHWILSDAAVVADQVIDGLRKGRSEITPSINGKVTLAMHRLCPLATRRSSRLLLKQSLFGAAKLP